MDERDVVRLMRRVAGIVAAIVATIASQARAADVDVARGVSDGNCIEVATDSVALLGDALHSAALVDKHCLSPLSPDLPAAMEAEREQILDQYDAWVRNVCLEKSCLSNEWADALSMTNDMWVARNVLAGCGAWQEAGSTMLIGMNLRYWSVRRSEFKIKSKLGRLFVGDDGTHNVLEIQNTQTGEVFYLDGWKAAAQARPWLAPTGADSLKVRKGDELVSAKSMFEWGNVANRGFCDNVPSLCDPRRCRK